MFRIFIICSDFSDNVQNLFSQCSESVQNFQSMFRIFSQRSECSESVKNFQSMFRMFRICSEFSVNVQNVQNLFIFFSEFLAQTLVYSEFLDFVVKIWCNYSAIGHSPFEICLLVWDNFSIENVMRLTTKVPRNSIYWQK